MKVVLPPPPDGRTVFTEYLHRLVRSLSQAFVPVVASNQAVSRIILLSPAGKSYDVTVDDAGVLHTTQNFGRSTVP